MKSLDQKDNTNIGYWEQVLEAPTPAYQELFDAEKKYLTENISADSFVLDIGCGEGRNMQSIFEKTKFVYGIDNDSKAVEDAHKRFDGIDTVKIFNASADKLPFENEMFDVVVIFHLIYNLNSDEIKKKVFSEIWRVLKKGGILLLDSYSEIAFDERMKIYSLIDAPIEKIEGTKVFFDGNVTSEQFSLDELRILGEKAGLTIIDSQKVGDIAYLVTYQK